jgi:MFS family permease
MTSEKDKPETGESLSEKNSRRYLIFVAVVIYLGWGLINTDGNLILVLSPQINSALGLSLTQYGYIVSAGFFASFILSLFLGPLADRKGRRFVLQFTMLGTAIFSVFQYFINSFASWFGIRIGAGAFTGGEWGAGATVLTETISKRMRGLVLSIMQSGWVFGYGLASLIALFALTFYGQAEGWRVAFLFAFLPALMVIVFRVYLKNPERFEHMSKVIEAKKKNKKEELSNLLTQYNIDTEKVDKPTYKQLFSKDLLRITIVVAFWNFMTTGIAITSNAFQPAYFEYVRHFPPSEIITMFTIVSFAGIIGYIANGLLNDRIGAKYSIVIFAVFEAFGIYALTFFTSSFASLAAFYVLFFFTENGQFSALIRMNTESFPTMARATGAIWGGAFWSLGQAVWPLMFGQMLATITFNQAWLWLEVVPELIAVVVLIVIMKNVPPKKELEEISI